MQYINNINNMTDKMTIPYSTKCSVAHHSKPTFTATQSLARSGGSISLNYYKGNPSSSSDVHPQIDRQCYHDGVSTVTASGSVDDSVSITAPGINYTSPSGATHSFSATGSSVPAGYYPVSVSHSNINYHPAGNVSVLTGSIGPISETTITPDKNEEVVCDPCSGECQGTSGTSGGSMPQSTRSVDNIVVAPFTSSSGGSGVVRTANSRHMRFAFTFGTFRGMGNLSSGQPEIVAFDYSASLLTPAAITFKHPLASVLIPQGDTAAANTILRIFDGASYTNYMVSGDGSCAFAVGATGKTSEQAHFVTAISKASSVNCNLSDENAAYLRISSADDSALFYDLATNEFAAMITSDGATILADEKLSILRDAEGVIRQIWNYWDGLADIVPAASGNGYTISLYLPSQVTAPAAEGSLFTFTGDPFKTFTVSGNAQAQSITIAERDLSLPETMPDYITTWTHTEAGWNLLRGEGDDLISETRQRFTDVESPASYRIVTTLSRGGVVASRTSEVFESSVRGELCLSRTDAYDTDIAQTTTFEYDEAGREVKRTLPDGGVYETVYDRQGRVTVRTSPWAGGQKQLISVTYRDDESSYSSDPATIVESVVNPSGTVVATRTDTYSYTEANHIKRVEISSTASGSSVTQTSVEETWLSTAPNPYARARTKMTQDINGVQTHYEYAAATQYNALYSVTSETRVAGATVPGQSRRTVEYISAEGNTLRHEEYILLPDGETWAQLSSVTNTYDVKNRLVGTLRSNGRSTTRTLTCTGDVLTETDENGLTISYGYDTARQLVEIIRSEVCDGETVISPETITTYTRDAAGRILSERTDTGAMVTVRTTQYDLLGRITSRTDELGRTATTTYSADGLTTTVTTPAGATLITTRHADGQPLSLSGTGQRALNYSYDMYSGNVRQIVLLPGGDTLARIVKNGFGQNVVNVKASTSGLIFTRSEYNAKGQLIKQYQDTGTTATAMAATVYEYDSMGNISKETLVLDEDAPADATGNRIRTSALSCEQQEDGTIWQVVTQTRNNAEGTMKSSTQKTLLSESATLESKTLTTDERGLTSTQSIAYTSDNSMARLHTETIPTSTLAATARVVDGFVTTQTDHSGITSSFTRAYTATGITQTATDGRGNTTTTHTDLAGRSISSTDAAGNTTTTVYDADFDQPSVNTNAQGKTACYKYDLRGRKVAEWGTAIQPALFGYDDAGNLTALTTFRDDSGDITTDPTGRADGDTTTWVYHPAAGVELSKTYADNSQVVKTYDAFNRLATETNARGIVKTLSYDAATGQLTGISFSDDETPSQSFAYNILGQLTQVTDAAGTRTIAYNEYSEQQSDSLNSGAHTHLVTELRDSYGRSTGFTYARSGATQFTTSVGYATDGRIATAGFMHGGVNRQFSYSYLSGSNLLHTLTQPNGLTLTQSYEEHRDLLTGMQYHRGSTLVVERSYSYDTLGRPTNRSTARQGSVKNDTFTHNDRSELTAATLGTDAYSYSYDNIGNRKTAQEAAEEATAYDANNLNQYTAIQKGTAEAFVPTFDADGNQTKVKTSTGIWNVVYNAENRPVTFTSEDGATIVECTYDYMGRRHTRKITVNGSVTNHLRYIYRGYLQIAAINAVSGAFQWFILWDPTQSVATRPLGIRKDGTWYTYGWDLTKNICEVFVSGGTIGAAYTYTPYGAVTANGNVTQPIQWSSEYNDTELGLVYYNYRHYNPADGRWIGRDPLRENTRRALYRYGNAVSTTDVLGLYDSYAAYVSAPDGNWTPKHLPWWLGLTPYERLNDRQGGFGGFAMDPYEPLPYKLTEPKLPNKEPVVGLFYSGNSKDFLRCGKISTKIGWPNSFATGSVVFDATAMNPSESHVVGAFVDKAVLGVGLSATYGLPSETATFALDIGKSTVTFTDSEIKFGYTPLKGVNMEAAFDKTSYQFNKASVMGGFQISEDLKANFGVNYTANSPNPLTILGGLSYKHSGNGSDWTMDFSISANQQEIVVGAGFSYSW